MYKIGSLLLGAAFGAVGISIVSCIYHMAFEENKNLPDNPFDDGNLDNYKIQKEQEVSLDETEAKSGENPFVGL